MRVRYENRGVHIYDRITGTHVLMDEIITPSEKIHIGPRVMSIALTNLCDSHCYFCYAPKTLDSLKPEYVYDLCQAMDTIGVLEVAFGGGEPTLYPDLSNLCKDIWNSTNLGISITTNGNNLTRKLIDDFVGNISIVRFSIDAMEPLYSQIRGHSISGIVDRISYIKNKIPFGINSVINNNTIGHLDAILKFAINYGAENILLLPQIENSKFVLSETDWTKLEKWINQNWREFPLEISSLARPFLNCPFLFNSEYEPRLCYWHISADRKIRETSYYGSGTAICDGSQLIEFFEKQKKELK